MSLSVKSADIWMKFSIDPIFHIFCVRNRELLRFMLMNFHNTVFRAHTCEEIIHQNRSESRIYGIMMWRTLIRCLQNTRIWRRCAKDLMLQVRHAWFGKPIAAPHQPLHSGQSPKPSDEETKITFSRTSASILQGGKAECREKNWDILLRLSWSIVWNYLARYFFVIAKSVSSKKSYIIQLWNLFYPPMQA